MNTNRQETSGWTPIFDRSGALGAGALGKALVGLVLGMALTSPASAQVNGRALGQAADLAGPHLGTTGSPIRVSPGRESEDCGTTRYVFNLGFTQATVECCVGAACEVLRGKIGVWGEAVGTLGNEGSMSGQGILEKAYIYGFGSATDAVPGGASFMLGKAVDGDYVRHGPNLTLGLDVSEFTWSTGGDETTTCPSARVVIEGPMVPASCDASWCGDESTQHFGFGPSLLTISSLVE